MGTKNPKNVEENDEQKKVTIRDEEYEEKKERKRRKQNWNRNRYARANGKSQFTCIHSFVGSLWFVGCYVTITSLHRE